MDGPRRARGSRRRAASGALFKSQRNVCVAVLGRRVASHGGGGQNRTRPHAGPTAQQTVLHDPRTSSGRSSRSQERRRGAPLIAGRFQGTPTRRASGASPWAVRSVTEWVSTLTCCITTQTHRVWLGTRRLRTLYLSAFSYRGRHLSRLRRGPSSSPRTQWSPVIPVTSRMRQRLLPT